MGQPTIRNPIVAVAMLEKFASLFGEHFSTPLLPPGWFREGRKKRNPRLVRHPQGRNWSFNILTAFQ